MLLILAAGLFHPARVSSGYASYANTTVSPIFDSCSDSFHSCADSSCCKHPGFACMRSRHDGSVSVCRPRQTPCQDDAHWLCPSGSSCTRAFQDCRTNLCCQKQPYYRGHKDVQFQCMRRPKLYYAQCRPPADPEHPSACTDTADWACPGWEACGGDFEACTKSRCCSTPGFSCYLNGSALEANQGWHAICLPKANQSNLEFEAGMRHGAMPSGRWIAIHDWFDHVHEVAAHTHWYVEMLEYAEESPLTVFSITSTMLLLLMCACCACMAHRRRMQDRLRKLEGELANAHAKAMRAAAREGSKVWGAQASELDDAAEPGTALHRALRTMSKQRRSSSWHV